MSQQSDRITPFHTLEQNQRHLKSELRHRSKWKKPVLIAPFLARAYTDPALCPVSKPILGPLRRVGYFSGFIFDVVKDE